MTDQEIIKRCAEKMGYAWCVSLSQIQTAGDATDKMIATPTLYDPLHNDAQAMALIRKFGLEIFKLLSGANWLVIARNVGELKILSEVESADLNRAICTCVAKLP